MSQGPSTSYWCVHYRVAQARGRASGHDCVDCGRAAAHWSYDHGDPDQRISERGQPYSLDLNRYQPRCRSCHCRFDRPPALPLVPPSPAVVRAEMEAALAALREVLAAAS